MNSEKLRLVYCVVIILAQLLECENSEVCVETSEQDKNDPYHVKPLDPNCANKPKRQSYDYQLRRETSKTPQSPPQDDDEKYHDTRILSERLSRISAVEETAEYWNEQAQNTLKDALNKENLNTNVAKNTIIYLGDGMGLQSVTAGRIMKGQLKGQSGEESKLAMESLPHFALSKTYNVDYQVPDSAATATAFLCGVKTRYYTVGVNAATRYGDCASSKGNELESVLKEAKKAGKSTGIVTTTYVVHATPAAAFASSASRTWYSDSDLPEEAKTNDCKDIAHQLYDNLPYIDVVLGGGRRYFRPNTVEDEDYPGNHYERADGQDFIKQWQMNVEASQENAMYVHNKQQFDKVPDYIDHLWGMFAPGSMDYEADRDPTMQPSLAEMTRKAIEILQKNPNGFYLLVEGARIDHSHHGGNAYRSLRDVVAFDDAIEVGLSMTSVEDTLSVVTADHSHTFNMGEYSVRGNPITGLAPSNEEPDVALDLKQYTALSYGNGPGYQGSTTVDYNDIVRENVTVELTENIYYEQQTAVPLGSESHGGEDVGIFATGPMAHLFHGVHEQNYIAHVMRYAACLGENQDHCLDREIVVTEPPEEDTIEFLGNQMTKADTEAALYSLFALELVFSIAIIGLCGVLIHKKKL
ncbi:alkaline phosphatase-like [Styela clava]